MKDPLYLRVNNNLFGLLFCCNSMLSYFVNSGEFRNGSGFVLAFQKAFSSRFDNINKGTLFSVYTSFANICYGLGEFKKSLFWLNLVLNDL